MLQRGTYSADGDLVDEDGSAWRRVVDWLEPDQAAAFFAAGMPYLVERLAATPERGRPERFERDILHAMITRGQADRLGRHGGGAAVMVGELWRNATRGDCLVFVEQVP